MNKNELSQALKEVNKAYKLIMDYQQRVAELIGFIKKELNAEHYWIELNNGFLTAQSIHKIYDSSTAGKDLLPMIDLQFLWHRTKGNWQDQKKGDLVFDIIISYNENYFEDNLNIDEPKLKIYIYKCVYYQRKNNWYSDIWMQFDYPEFKKKAVFKDPNSENQYEIYGEEFYLSEFTNELETKTILNKFRKRVSNKLQTEI